MPEFVVYFSSEETAPLDTHQTINRREVYLSKSENDFRSWKMEREGDGGSVSTHQGVES